MVMKKIMLVAAALAIPAGFAMAENAATAEKANKPKIAEVCKTDIDSLCGGKKKAKCLRENEAKLSPDCAKAVAAKPADWGRKDKPAAPATTGSTSPAKPE